MNWKLIFALSSFGLFMAIGTIFWISSSIEPWIWLTIFIYNAWLIAKYVHKNHFLTGLLVGLMNSIWITALHYLFYESYISNHPEMLNMMKEGDDIKTLMLITGPIIGLLSGIILGVFSLFAVRLTKHSK